MLRFTHAHLFLYIVTLVSEVGFEINIFFGDDLQADWLRILKIDIETRTETSARNDQRTRLTVMPEKIKAEV